MKPAPFRYLDPPDLDGVLAALAEHGDDAALIAGGQSLVPLMNLRLARPEVVVDPRRVDGLDAVRVDDGVVEVGALVTASELLAHSEVPALLPGLADALSCVGHVQIRNRSTIGGSVAHADPSAELPAVLVGCDGEVVLRSVDGTRTVAAAHFFDGPFSTVREAHEMITAVRIPVPDGASGWQEIARRPGDFALVGLFAAVVADEGPVTGARLAFSGVADRPVRVPDAEQQLVGRPLDADALTACADAVIAALDPPDDVHATGAHRSALAATLVRRLLPRLAPSRTRP